MLSSLTASIIPNNNLSGQSPSTIDMNNPTASVASSNSIRPQERHLLK